MSMVKLFKKNNQRPLKASSGLENHQIQIWIVPWFQAIKVLWVTVNIEVN